MHLSFINTALVGLLLIQSKEKECATGALTHSWLQAIRVSRKYSQLTFDLETLPSTQISTPLTFSNVQCSIPTPVCVFCVLFKTETARTEVTYLYYDPCCLYSLTSVVTSKYISEISDPELDVSN